MVYPPPAGLPGETSRTARTTAAGTPFIDIAFTLNGDACRALVPTGYDTVSDPVVFVALHGHGGTQATIDGAGITPRRDHYLDLGHVWVSSNAKGNAWATDAAQQAYVDVATWADTNLRVSTHQVLHGASMGGLTAALMYARGLMSKVVCAILVDPAVNLAYAHGKAPYQAAIRTAYGIAGDGSDYAAKTAGHDAVLRAPADFTGKRLQLSASPADTSIAKTANADVFMTNMAGAPRLLQLVATTGPHVDPANYPLQPFVEFVDAALGLGPDPKPPTTVYLPTGVLGVEAYIVVGGQPVRFDPTSLPIG